MNRLRKIGVMVLGGWLINICSAWAFDVPSYIKDPQNVNENICIIIEQNTLERGRVTDGAAMDRKRRETINEYAARLYADALSTRAGLSTEGGTVGTIKAVGKNVLNSLMGSADKQQILQNDVKPQIKEIALTVKKIVELEAAIANLQGVQMLSNMDYVGCSDDEEDDDETEGGSAAAEEDEE